MPRQQGNIALYHKIVALSVERQRQLSSTQLKLATSFSSKAWDA
jgi:hypothetical protein